MSKRYPGVIARGGKLYVKVKTADGKWERRATGLPVGQEALAARVRDGLMQRAAASAEDSIREHTVRTYGQLWLKRRNERGRVVHHQEGYLKHHVWPRIGDMLLAEVRPRHVRRLVEDLQHASVMGTRTEGQLAPRTVRHIYSTLRAMFGEAAVDELIEQSPCILQRHHLPPDQDKDSSWRAGAVFSLDEIVQLITDERIPEVRRVLYAMLSLGGPRASSCVVRRWRDIELHVKPLGRMLLATKWRKDRREEVPGSKAGVPIAVPIHPVLSDMLRAWRNAGWHVMMGRHATADDLVVPTERGNMRKPNNLWQSLQRDLDLLGLRRRGTHVLRASFITHARASGARPDILKLISHGPSRREIVDVYTRLPWSALCAEIAKLQIPTPNPAWSIWSSKTSQGAI